MSWSRFIEIRKKPTLHVRILTLNEIRNISDLSYSIHVKGIKQIRIKLPTSIIRCADSNYYTIPDYRVGPFIFEWDWNVSILLIYQYIEFQVLIFDKMKNKTKNTMLSEQFQHPVDKSQKDTKSIPLALCIYIAVRCSGLVNVFG